MPDVRVLQLLRFSTAVWLQALRHAYEDPESSDEDDEHEFWEETEVPDNVGLSEGAKSGDPRVAALNIPCPRTALEQPQTLPPPHPQNSKKKRDKRRSKEKRFKKKWGPLHASNPLRRMIPRPNPACALRKISASLPLKPTASFSIENLSVTRPGYEGSRLQGTRPSPKCLADYVLDGFQHIRWDGRTPTPLVDDDGFVYAVLVGRPIDDRWDHVTSEAWSAMQSTCSSTVGSHRRGAFSAVNCGVGIGQGTGTPLNLRVAPRLQPVVETLKQNASFQRISGFANGAFRTWAPHLFALYDGMMAKLLTQHADLEPIFANSVWASTAFNFGPQTVCSKHRDSKNLAHGWCAITALGEFDHRQGGQLVLWEIKTVVDFAAGSTVLIPSAAVAHSNALLGEGEQRGSFTQYTPAGLFRWVDCGFRKMSSYEQLLSEEEWVKERLERAERVNRARQLFSTLATLVGQ